MKSIRPLVMGLKTLLGRPQGFFIPYRYAETVPKGHDLPAYPAALACFDAAAPVMEDWLARVTGFRADLNRIGPDEPPEPRWNQSWFPPLDAAILYAILRHECPQTLIEIGSGHSSRFSARAIRDGLLDTRFIAIDPAPRAVIEGLPILFHRTTLDQDHSPIFSDLAAGDVLFIDSSHILMPGTDVDILFNRILPELPAGVLVHIHDICLPDPYPASWTWRGYNEQLAVLPLVTGGGYDVLFSSWYADRYLKAQVRDAVGFVEQKAGAMNTSLWLRKR